MKILVLTNAYPPYITGGYEIACYDNVQRLRSKGHDVHVLTSTYRKFENSPLDSDKKVYRKLMLEAKFYQFHPFPLLKYKSLRQVVAKYRDSIIFKYSLNQIKPDIVFFWNMGLISFFLIDIAEKSLPTAYYLSDSWLSYPPLYVEYKECDGLKQEESPVKLKRFLSKITRPRKIYISLPKNVIFCSNALKQLYYEFGYSFRNPSIIYHGIDPLIFHPIVDKVKTDNTVKLLFCGRISKFKGIETVIYAIWKLINRYNINNISLNIVGDGQKEYIKYLKNKVNKLSLSAFIHWISKAERNNMPEIYCSHDILIFPSIWQEPFSITILEAMSCGIPIIGTLTGGSKEILVDNENSLVFKEGNSNQLTNKIKLLIENKDLRKKIIKKGLETANNYTLDTMADRVEKYLLSVIEQK